MDISRTLAISPKLSDTVFILHLSDLVPPSYRKRFALAFSGVLVPLVIIYVARVPDGGFDADCAAPTASFYSVPGRLITPVLALCTSPVAWLLLWDAQSWALASVASGTTALYALP